MSTYSVKNIHWLGHASFRIESAAGTIYIDPWQLGPKPKPADLILITHEHRDHCSPEDIAKIQTPETVIVTTKMAAAQLSGKITIVQPGDHLTVQDVEIEAVAAYNVNKFRSPRVPFHPKENKYVGFIVTVAGQKIYHAGDTDVIPEMQSFETDVALLPVSGTYTMTADEALEAAEIINPKVVVPMHIGRGIGAASAAEDFKTKCPIPVEILTLES
jgi:L-ascorbate metabolism protein UlaG (beta-lactamase superfamily)